MRSLLAWPLRYGLATGAAVLASLRLAWLLPRLPFDELVARLRAGRRFGALLRDPTMHERVVGRLLPALPPFGAGPCLKRSLLLLHLWSRCGREPRLHLGARRVGDGPIESHAWLEVDLGEDAQATGGGPFETVAVL